MDDAERTMRLQAALAREKRAAGQLSELTQARDVEFAAAVAEGWTFYRIHKATGMAESAVAKSARRAQSFAPGQGRNHQPVQ